MLIYLLKFRQIHQLIDFYRFRMVFFCIPLELSLGKSEKQRKLLLIFIWLSLYAVWYTFIVPRWCSLPSNRLHWTILDSLEALFGEFYFQPRNATSRNVSGASRETLTMCTALAEIRIGGREVQTVWITYRMSNIVNNNSESRYKQTRTWRDRDLRIN